MRHACFTGAREPHPGLQGGSRAETDESRLGFPPSHPQPPLRRPATGRIAVKIINHSGDEVLKVYETRLDSQERDA
jgi:adenine-specific DNA-methyltransferase